MVSYYICVFRRHVRLNSANEKQNPSLFVVSSDGMEVFINIAAYRAPEGRMMG